MAECADGEKSLKRGGQLLCGWSAEPVELQKFKLTDKN